LPWIDELFATRICQIIVLNFKPPYPSSACPWRRPEMSGRAIDRDHRIDTGERLAAAQEPDEQAYSSR
jgi:hypothetical protein